MAKQQQQTKKSKKVQWNFPFTKANFMLFGLGVLVIIIGYALMATAITDDPAKYQDSWNNVLAVNVAPIVLVIGYCVIIPFAILKTVSSKKETKE